MVRLYLFEVLPLCQEDCWKSSPFQNNRTVKFLEDLNNARGRGSLVWLSAWVCGCVRLSFFSVSLKDVSRGELAEATLLKTTGVNFYWHLLYDTLMDANLESRSIAIPASCCCIQQYRFDYSSFYIAFPRCLSIGLAHVGISFFQK